MAQQKGRKDMNVRFPNHIHDALDEVAKREGRSKNAAVLWAIIDYLRERGYEIDMVELREVMGEEQKGDTDSA